MLGENQRNRKIVKDKKFLMWVCENHKCYVCGLFNQKQTTPTQAHHLQGKYRIGAMIRDDSTVLPICFNHHQELTFKKGERKFWEELKVDPFPESKLLREQYEKLK